MGRPTKLKVLAIPNCIKCGTKTLKTILSYSIDHTQIKMCNTCFNKWLDIKDKVVGEAFASYIQAGHSTGG